MLLVAGVLGAWLWASSEMAERWTKDNSFSPDIEDPLTLQARPEARTSFTQRRVGST